MIGSGAKEAQRAPHARIAAVLDQRQQRAEHGGAEAGQHGQRERVPGHAAALAGIHAAESPDALARDPRQPGREAGPAGFVEKGAGQRAQHRKGDEHHQQARAADHRRGDEQVALEGAAARDAEGAQHHERRQHQHRAPAEAGLARAGGRIRQPDEETLRQHAGDAERTAPGQQPSLCARRRHAERGEADDQRPGAQQQPGPPVQQHLRQGRWSCRARPSVRPAPAGRRCRRAGCTRAAARRRPGPAPTRARSRGCSSWKFMASQRGSELTSRSQRSMSRLRSADWPYFA